MTEDKAFEEYEDELVKIEEQTKEARAKARETLREKLKPFNILLSETMRRANVIRQRVKDETRR